jgi:putative protein kinase ArgK-like GTPase of G3E family
MPARPDDDAVFIRSLAAASGRGAVAEHLEVLLRILAAHGFDLILIETAGAGQGDTAVRALADVIVLLLQPEMGDDLQWEKAGLLEVADVIAVNKADLPQAEQVEAQVRTTLGLSPERAVTVLRVSAKTGEGVEALWAAVADCPARRPAPADAGATLLRRTQELLAQRFAQAQAAARPELGRLLDQWRQGALSEADAIGAFLRLLLA